MGKKRGRAASKCPEFTVDFGGFWGPEWNDDSIDQNFTDQPGEVDHTGIVQEFAEIASDIQGGRAIRGAELNQEDAGFLLHK